MSGQKYVPCNLCGSQIPEGHPCMKCVEIHRLFKKKAAQITPEQIAEFVSILRVKEGDIIVIKDDAITEDNMRTIGQVLVDILGTNIKIGLMSISKDAEFLIIRNKDDKK